MSVGSEKEPLLGSFARSTAENGFCDLLSTTSFFRGIPRLRTEVGSRWFPGPEPYKVLLISHSKLLHKECIIIKFYQLSVLSTCFSFLLVDSWNGCSYLHAASTLLVFEWFYLKSYLLLKALSLCMTHLLLWVISFWVTTIWPLETMDFCTLCKFLSVNAWVLVLSAYLRFHCIY